MPVYEYDCMKCLSRFEVTRGFHETGGNSCPKCGAEGRRIYFSPHLVFKGPGFYVTDSRTEVDPSLEEGQTVKTAPDKSAKEPDLKIPGTESEKGKPSAKSERVKPITKPE